MREAGKCNHSKEAKFKWEKECELHLHLRLALLMQVGVRIAWLPQGMACLLCCGNNLSKICYLKPRIIRHFKAWEKLDAENPGVWSRHVPFSVGDGQWPHALAWVMSDTYKHWMAPVRCNTSLPSAVFEGLLVTVFLYKDFLNVRIDIKWWFLFLFCFFKSSLCLDT